MHARLTRLVLAAAALRSFITSRSWPTARASSSWKAASTGCCFVDRRVPRGDRGKHGVRPDRMSCRVICGRVSRVRRIAVRSRRSRLEERSRMPMGFEHVGSISLPAVTSSDLRHIEEHGRGDRRGR